MKVIATRCQKALSERQGAMNYLVNKRHLPDDIEWLKANFLGAVPADLPVAELKKKAGEILTENMKVAYAAAKAEELPILRTKEQVEILNIERFFSTLDGVMNSINVAGAVAFIYTNHHGHVTSINFDYTPWSRRVKPSSFAAYRLARSADYSTPRCCWVPIGKNLNTTTWRDYPLLS